MKKIINPVVLNICRNFSYYMNILRNKRRVTSQFEAFSRTFNGISLWLNLRNISNINENYYHHQIRKCIILTINLLFNESSKFHFITNIQYVVEAAFFSQGLLRSWNTIWTFLHNTTKQNIIRELKSTRKFKTSGSNWILFSTMIEIILYKVENISDVNLIKNNFNTYMSWYKGDGWYGDGDEYHFDYYNSYVIQPFVLEIAIYILDLGLFKIDINRVKERFKRYVHCLERMINSDGTYPIIGRSITYRFGAFNPLALAVFYNIIPSGISKGMINRGLTLILKRIISYPIFNNNGILNIGLTNSNQKNLGEIYISEGSTYLCTFIFSVLGIEENNSFWKTEELITSEKAWEMKIIDIDKPYY